MFKILIVILFGALQVSAMEEDINVQKSFEILRLYHQQKLITENSLPHIDEAVYQNTLANLRKELSNPDSGVWKELGTMIDDGVAFDILPEQSKYLSLLGGRGFLDSNGLDIFFLWNGRDFYERDRITLRDYLKNLKNDEQKRRLLDSLKLSEGLLNFDEKNLDPLLDKEFLVEDDELNDSINKMVLEEDEAEKEIWKLKTKSRAHTDSLGLLSRFLLHTDSDDRTGVVSVSQPVSEKMFSANFIANLLILLEQSRTRGELKGTTFDDIWQQLISTKELKGDTLLSGIAIELDNYGYIKAVTYKDVTAVKPSIATSEVGKMQHFVRTQFLKLFLKSLEECGYFAADGAGKYPYFMPALILQGYITNSPDKDKETYSQVLDKHLQDQMKKYTYGQKTALIKNLNVDIQRIGKDKTADKTPLKLLNALIKSINEKEIEINKQIQKDLFQATNFIALRENLLKILKESPGDSLETFEKYLNNSYIFNYLSAKGLSRKSQVTNSYEVNKKKTPSYTNCVETGLANFVSFLAFDQQNVDFSRAEKIKDKNIEALVKKATFSSRDFTHNFLVDRNWLPYVNATRVNDKKGIKSLLDLTKPCFFISIPSSNYVQLNEQLRENYNGKPGITIADKANVVGSACLLFTDTSEPDQEYNLVFIREDKNVVLHEVESGLMSFHLFNTIICKQPKDPYQEFINCLLDDNKKESVPKAFMDSMKNDYALKVAINPFSSTLKLWNGTCNATGKRENANEPLQLEFDISSGHTEIKFMSKQNKEAFKIFRTVNPNKFSSFIARSLDSANLPVIFDDFDVQNWLWLDKDVLNDDTVLREKWDEVSKKFIPITVADEVKDVKFDGCINFRNFNQCLWIERLRRGFSSEVNISEVALAFSNLDENSKDYMVIANLFKDRQQVIDLPKTRGDQVNNSNKYSIINLMLAKEKLEERGLKVSKESIQELEEITIENFFEVALAFANLDDKSKDYDLISKWIKNHQQEIDLPEPKGNLLDPKYNKHSVIDLMIAKEKLEARGLKVSKKSIEVLETIFKKECIRVLNEKRYGTSNDVLEALLNCCTLDKDFYKELLDIAVKKNDELDLLLVYKKIATLKELVDIKDESNNTPLNLVVQKYIEKKLNKSSYYGTVKYESKYIETIECLVKNKANIYEQNSNEKTPLGYALEKDVYEITRILVKDNVTEANAQTLLYLASKNSDIDTVKSCLSHKIEINEKDTKGKTALDYALLANNKSLKIAKLLIENGAKVNEILEKSQYELLTLAVEDISKSIGWNYNNLVEALEEESKEEEQYRLTQKSVDFLISLKKEEININARNGQSNVLNVNLNENYKNGITQLLIEQGADPGVSALSCAIYGKDSILFNYLIERTSNFNNALFTAIESNQADFIEHLIIKGADVNCENERKYKPLNTAIQNLNVEAFNILINNKADVNIPDNGWDGTLLHQIARKDNLNTHSEDWKEKQLHIAKVLLEKLPSETLDELDENKKTALSLAIKNKNEELIELIAKKDLVRQEVKDSLFHIFNSNNIDKGLAIKLLKAGVTTEKLFSAKETYLHKAVETNDCELVKAVLEHNKDIVNIGDENNDTPLHYAAAENNFEMVQLLVKYGANVGIVDIYSSLPADYGENAEIKAFLETAAKAPEKP